MKTSYLLTFIFFFSLSVLAQPSQENLIAASVTQLNGQEATCHYQLSQTAIPVNNIYATIDTLTLPVLSQQSYPFANQSTAILFLLDTSNPARQNIVDQKKQHIKILLTQLKPHHRVGLAKFDTEFTLISPLHENPQNLLEPLDNLQATGLTTELYRSTRDAIRHLATVEADRKVIYLLSDGKAEDTAYNHTDVVTEALKHNINIVGIGYTNTVSGTTDLAVLRRLSEETYGAYYQAELNTFALPDTLTQNPFAIIDSGGHIAFDLSPLLQHNINEPITMMINWETDHLGTIQKQFPLNTEMLIAPPIEAQPEIEEVITEPNLLNKYWWLFLLLGAALLFIFIILFIKRKKASDTGNNETEQDSYAFSETTEDEEETQIPFRTVDDLESIELEETPYIATKPIAYLFVLSKNNNTVAEKHPIYSSSVRIGRHKDNDIQLTSLSVSSHHAEIHRKRNGQFIVNDLGALNKIYLNNKEVKQAVLSDEDLIQLGEVRLVFSLKNIGN